MSFGNRRRDGRRRPGWRLSFIPLVVGMLAALGLGSGSAQAVAPFPTNHPPIHSGLPWASGVFVDSWSQSDVAAFGQWRGHPLDVAVTWPQRQTWADFTQPNANYQAFAHAPYTMSFGVPPIPEDGSATLAQCAAGDYQDQWVTFAHTMRSYGLQSSIIRLGWEFNGNWYAWGGDATDFAGCWRQVVTTVKRIDPLMKFDWNPDRGSAAGLPGDEVLQAYPGNAYVDYVGVDSYDFWGSWDDQLNGGYGLNYWLDFAIAHGKKLSVPEWGLYPASPEGHGDDAAYIQGMHDFFATNAKHIAYESYFNEPADYIADSLFNPDQNPESSALYQRLW
jgi:hypothetical protein